MSSSSSSFTKDDDDEDLVHIYEVDESEISDGESKVKDDDKHDKDYKNDDDGDDEEDNIELIDYEFQRPAQRVQPRVRSSFSFVPFSIPARRTSFLHKPTAITPHHSPTSSSDQPTLHHRHQRQNASAIVEWSPATTVERFIPERKIGTSSSVSLQSLIHASPGKMTPKRNNNSNVRISSKTTPTPSSMPTTSTPSTTSSLSSPNNPPSSTSQSSSISVIGKTPLDSHIDIASSVETKRISTPPTPTPKQPETLLTAIPSTTPTSLSPSNNPPSSTSQSSSSSVAIKSPLDSHIDGSSIETKMVATSSISTKQPETLLTAIPATTVLAVSPKESIASTPNPLTPPRILTSTAGNAVTQTNASPSSVRKLLNPDPVATITPSASLLSPSQLTRGMKTSPLPTNTAKEREVETNQSLGPNNSNIDDHFENVVTTSLQKTPLESHPLITTPLNTSSSSSTLPWVPETQVIPFI